MNIEIRDLGIEITRRCNMTCDHCLRGDAENVDILLTYVDTLFSKIDVIGCLLLTGGEPSLVPHIINQILDLAIKHKVEIHSFDITTNAKKITMEFVCSLLRLYQECAYDEEGCQATWSNDFYHNSTEIDKDGLRLLQGLSFVKARHMNEGQKFTLLDQGKASFYYAAPTEVKPPEYRIEDDEDNQRIDEGMIYLNTKGMIIAGCDWSYESQDDEDNDADCQICHVNDFTVEKVLDFAGVLV